MWMAPQNVGIRQPSCEAQELVLKEGDLKWFKYEDLLNQSKSHVDQVVVDVKIQYFGIPCHVI